MLIQATCIQLLVYFMHNLTCWEVVSFKKTLLCQIIYFDIKRIINDLEENNIIGILYPTKGRI